VAVVAVGGGEDEGAMDCAQPRSWMLQIFQKGELNTFVTCRAKI
jgi:hypothetical protein